MKKITTSNNFNKRDIIRELVNMSLAFHNLNKLVEQKTGISLVQYHFLNTLRDMPGCSPMLLAKAVGMHPSTLTQSIKRLSNKELIFIGEDPKDYRKKILALNSNGQEALLIFENKIDELLKEEKNLTFWPNSSSKNASSIKSKELEL